MLQLSYVTIYRSAEICTFEFDSIKQMTNLRRSKTGKHEKGKLTPILQTLVDLIDDWKHKADIEIRKFCGDFFKG